MLAGLFAQHGFFFGKCRPADDRNPKGFFENLQIYKGRRDVLKVLKEEGLQPGQNWGVKVGHSMYPKLKPPVDLTLATWRDPDQIAASRKRAKGFGGKGGNMDPKRIIEPYRVINTTKLGAGDFSEVRDAFALLDVPFDMETARAWIAPEIWNRGMEA